MRYLAFAFRSSVPPKSLQLWNVGDNPTDYGVHRWTERSAQLVMAAYRERGNRLQIDIEHNAREPAPPGVTPELGGYADLELVGGAPWLRFDWSAPAVEQIATRQRLYLSPEYDVDEETGEIVGLVRVSLVGSPGTHFARVLASKGTKEMTLKEAIADWLEEQPAAVQNAYVAALVRAGGAPKGKTSSPLLAKPSRPSGAPNSEPVTVAARGLSGIALAEFNRACRVERHAASEPAINPEPGLALRICNVPPAQLRRMKARRGESISGLSFADVRALLR